DQFANAKLGRLLDYEIKPLAARECLSKNYVGRRFNVRFDDRFNFDADARFVKARDPSGVLRAASIKHEHFLARLHPHRANKVMSLFRRQDDRLAVYLRWRVVKSSSLHQSHPLHDSAATHAASQRWR